MTKVKTLTWIILINKNEQICDYLRVVDWARKQSIILGDKIWMSREYLLFEFSCVIYLHKQILKRWTKTEI